MSYSKKNSVWPWTRYFIFLNSTWRKIFSKIRYRQNYIKQIYYFQKKAIYKRI